MRNITRVCDREQPALHMVPQAPRQRGDRTDPESLAYGCTRKAA